MLVFLQKVIDVILPPRCLLCGKIVADQNGLCQECFDKIKFISTPYCLKCGNPLPTGNSVQSCSLCVSDNKNPFRMQRSRVYYDDASRPLIVDFKFHDKTENAEFLTRWLLTAGHDIWQQGADILIPVPVHASRLRERKFNQAALLCKELSKLTQIQANYTVLQKTKKTKPQVECDSRTRVRNLKNAFSVNNIEELKDKRVVLIDDVMTTGSTLKECANVLLKAGVKSVDALTVARVIKNS
ncbi:MAG: ComF family protein [Alphaproteobacteria bacterium]|nr:ComF family protein [Alphaproteobacteria bacterium]